MCLGRPPWPVIVLVAVVELAVLAYLLRRPEGPCEVVAADAATTPALPPPP
jgi:protein TonB